MPATILQPPSATWSIAAPTTWTMPSPGCETLPLKFIGAVALVGNRQLPVVLDPDAAVPKSGRELGRIVVDGVLKAETRKER